MELNSNQGTDETKYEYDSAGNIIKVIPAKTPAMDYIYDSLNRLDTVKLDNKEIANYDYNAFSQRILKTVNGAKTIFIYNSAGQLLEEQNKQQNTTRDYVYVDGQLIAAIENGITSYITTDHLNAPQIITSQTGQTIWSAKYDPFGKATVTGNIKYNLRANGQYQDDETNLYYNWYRYYSPELGRYITSDPIGLQAGANTYVYVNGNPINYTDPMGLWWVPIARAMAVGAGIGSSVEITSEMINNGYDVSKLSPSNIAIAGAFGATTGGIGGATARMSIAKAIAINTTAGAVAGGGQQLATNACNGADLSDGVWQSAAWGSGLNGLGNAIPSLSRSSFSGVAKANNRNIYGTKEQKAEAVNVMGNIGENVGSWVSNIGTSFTQIYLGVKNQNKQN